MSDAELINLYSGRILELTVQIPHLGRLSAPQGSASKRSPQCGSAVTVDLTLADGRIAAFAQDVKACALGQAAAALVGGAVIGRSRAEIEKARAEIAAMLLGGPVPSAPFEGFEVLTPARAFKNRHASILLSIDATAAALAQIDDAGGAA